jgi:drug/metabolite transporter (DMT)-like permease
MIGILGGFANLWLTQAYKLAEVSLVAPLRYLSIIFAISCGYLIWNEIPTSKTMIGAFFVISASLIIFIREFRKKKFSIPRHE